MEMDIMVETECEVYGGKLHSNRYSGTRDKSNWGTRQMKRHGDVGEREGSKEKFTDAATTNMQGLFNLKRRWGSHYHQRSMKAVPGPETNGRQGLIYVFFWDWIQGGNWAETTWAHTMHLNKCLENIHWNYKGDKGHTWEDDWVGNLEAYMAQLTKRNYGLAKGTRSLKTLFSFGGYQSSKALKEIQKGLEWVMGLYRKNVSSPGMVGWEGGGDGTLYTHNTTIKSVRIQNLSEKDKHYYLWEPLWGGRQVGTACTLNTLPSRDYIFQPNLSGYGGYVSSGFQREGETHIWETILGGDQDQSLDWDKPDIILENHYIWFFNWNLVKNQKDELNVHGSMIWKTQKPKTYSKKDVNGKGAKGRIMVYMLWPIQMDSRPTKDYTWYLLPCTPDQNQTSTRFSLDMNPSRNFIPQVEKPPDPSMFPPIDSGNGKRSTPALAVSSKSKKKKQSSGSVLRGNKSSQFVSLDINKFVEEIKDAQSNLGVESGHEPSDGINRTPLEAEIGLINYGSGIRMAIHEANQQVNPACISNSNPQMEGPCGMNLEASVPPSLAMLIDSNEGLMEGLSSDCDDDEATDEEEELPQDCGNGTLLHNRLPVEIPVTHNSADANQHQSIGTSTSPVDTIQPQPQTQTNGGVDSDQPGTSKDPSAGPVPGKNQDVDGFTLMTRRKANTLVHQKQDKAARKERSQVEGIRNHSNKKGNKQQSGTTSNQVTQRKMRDLYNDFVTSKGGHEIPQHPRQHPSRHWKPKQPQKSKNIQVSNQFEVLEDMVFSEMDLEAFVRTGKIIDNGKGPVNSSVKARPNPTQRRGVPLISSRLSCRDCSPLVDKIRKRIQDWKNKSLSFAGRLLLIKSVLSATQVYWASVFVLPISVLNDLEKMCRSFLWNNSDPIRGKAKVKWKECCLPVKHGGLGLKSLRSWNTALMSRHIWNIISHKNSLWVKWVNQYHLKGRNFWEIPIKREDCWSWRKLLQQRDLLHNHMISIIGNGLSTSAWYDNWHPTGPLCKVLTHRNTN
ncbi:hypothetical protein E3N88_34247 [Mikania micrantha]|uniref:Reverse transcriptase zinc-binding domain-containing protein n=1 Tax=Mikania micrantha TaxID=192012 RepID=A0A5N6LXK4_9ASTR|nr:hypothetical protein E3N88_34247 [Mikania micrantha]